MRYWSPSQIHELARASGFADVRLRADGFFSQNPQISDLDLLSLLGKLTVLFSYLGCKTAGVVSPLAGIADSLWLQARKADRAEAADPPSGDTPAATSGY